MLVDKESFASALPNVSGGKPTGRPPEEAEFLEVVNGFWYHTVWSAKKLRRGELFIAKSCCDNTMKPLLRREIEWHARATHGWEYDIWHDGRFPLAPGFTAGRRVLLPATPAGSGLKKGGPWLPSTGS